MPSTHLLVFGSPGAGKTALVEAAEKVSGPFSSELNVLDCDGKAALQMLQAEEPFANSHPMKRPILDADAVVLVVDVSAPKKQVNDDFRQSARWLKHLHEIRGRRADIAELPVYVVLAKCDLLGKKDDTLESWKNRVDEVKRQYEDNFRKYLKQHGPGFGTIKLTILPTAVKHPPLADRPAKTPEPFGVTEVFADCVRSAGDFQERRRTAQGRLHNVIFGLIGLIALLGVSVAFLFEFQPPPRGTTLDERVRAALPKPTATAVERLAGTTTRLQERAKALAEIAAADEFSSLPADTRNDVVRYRDEIATYLQLQQKAQTELKLPHLAKNDAELKEMEKTVRAFALPEAHAQDWTDTRLARRLRQVTDEYDALQASLKGEAAWLTRQIDANRKQLIAGNAINGSLLKREPDASQQAKAWQRELQTQLNAKPPTAREDSVPGVARLIYDDLAKFEPVKSAHKAWLASQDDLRSEWTTMQKRLNALP